ncbi:serine/threonine-protein kinase [Rubinisphaera margarita]|uniref:serine/threonine-protein kinase n=1 Tax=Rubinisphaera margarita TaxID=2909586 RepID=UPI001EE8D5C1|nr:serine/threonine-protein kinase [Rubinisphaera margarita]MCG6156110.1 serine/threonine protein kinase [Rubinisphaera margarita]
MSPTTMNAFAEALKKSGLISEDRYQARMADLEASNVNLGDARQTARAFIDSGDITTWQAEKLLAGKHKGFFLGKYKLLKLLGRGGMSAVYLAEHSVMKRHCAIKVLPSSRVNDTSYLGRFHLEAQAAASLDDPHIVRAYDVDHFSDGKADVHFLVMEYVEGRNLHEVIMQDGPLDPVDAAEHIRQAAKGLQHAHEEGLVHRDIKPGNLLLDQKGVVKILDMGLARFFNESDDKSLTIQHDERVLGTADFLAPEQAINSHNVDSRADIYSLGCTFYFLLTRHAPFEQGSLAQRLMAHQTQEPPAISTYRTDVPESLTQIIEKMMAKKADDRFQTAEEISSALKDWISANADQEWLEEHEKQWESTGRRTISSAAPPKISESMEVAPATDEFGDFLTMIGNDTTDSDRGLLGGPRSGGKSGKKLSGISRQPKSDSGSSLNPADISLDEKESGRRAAKSSGGLSAIPSDSAIPAGSNVVEAEPEPVPSQPASRKRRAAAVSPLDKAKNWLQANPKMATGIGVAVLALVLAPLFFSGGDTPDTPNGSNQQGGGSSAAAVPNTPPEMPEDAPIVGVQMTIGEGGTFPTITKAFEYLKTQDNQFYSDERRMIIKAGTELNESVELIDPPIGFPSRMRILPESEKPIVWKGAEGSTILRLQNVEGLILENIHFQAQNSNEAIYIAERCPGLVLRNCRIEGYTQVGVDMAGVAGLYSTPCRLDRCTIRSDVESSVGVVLRSGEATCESIDVTNCRFVGPAQAGFICRTDLVRWLNIQESTFRDLVTGIQVDTPQPTLESVVLSNNTFASCGTAIEFQSVPADNSNALVLSRNLFVDSRQADFTVRQDGNLDQLTGVIQANPPGTAWNWTTKAKPAEGTAAAIAFGENSKFDVKDIEFRSTDAEKWEYLKPANGKGRIPGAQGYKPYVGAVSP